MTPLPQDAYPTRSRLHQIRLVVSHLPKAEQPVDPHTYGTSTRPAR